MSEQLQEKTQSTIFYIPRLDEYAGAVSRIMRELKNIGASPGQIIRLLKSEPEPPESQASSHNAVLQEKLNYVDARMTELETMADDLKEVTNNLETCLRVTADNYFNSNYDPFLYTAQKIARKLGIYSMYGRPHAHAVSAILNNKLRIDGGHKEDRLLFKTNEVEVWYTRYDEYAFECVRGWITTFGLPEEIDGFYYTYHIRYYRD